MDDVEVDEVVVVDADVDAVDADVDVEVLVLQVLWVYLALSKVELPSDRLWRRLTEGESTQNDLCCRSVEACLDTLSH